MSTLMSIYLASSAPCTPGCEARRPLLVELNGATNGRNWHRPWNISATSVCDFGRGITCTNDDIDELYLYDNNLDGTLPESLASLTALQKFGMPYNNLRGTIPKVWKSLAKLNLFDFMSNALVGPLPDDFGAGWPLMNSFSITNNFINGTLPESYAQLPLEIILSKGLCQRCTGVRGKSQFFTFSCIQTDSRERCPKSLACGGRSRCLGARGMVFLERCPHRMPHGVPYKMLAYRIILLLVHYRQNTNLGRDLCS
ncbi:GP46-like surface antigen, putative [Bodo saltans]|uniref:GP46-like surface antigen, putative n=1 Tax=Bodo saltans TaxID=75058 RepID=A0A0S4IUK8_BODSA|nr:GP46-like surface antigen, putative [Bodo saltans]|eukprot:CUF33810.1 GP46-like surface antigen, putative [Bodo saltans]